MRGAEPLSDYSDLIQRRRAAVKLAAIILATGMFLAEGTVQVTAYAWRFLKQNMETTTPAGVVPVPTSSRFSPSTEAPVNSTVPSSIPAELTGPATELSGVVAVRQSADGTLIGGRITNPLVIRTNDGYKVVGRDTNSTSHQLVEWPWSPDNLRICADLSSRFGAKAVQVSQAPGGELLADNTPAGIYDAGPLQPDSCQRTLDLESLLAENGNN